MGNVPFAPALAPGGRKLYVTGSDATVSVIDTATHKVTSTFACPERAEGVRRRHRLEHGVVGGPVSDDSDDR
ncbi:hypothetical protein OHB05_36050 [Streptomyces sp. NBC_00638]|uniref:hypothetical protein n=1 Tax=unclassified Streptomyces TaxID=2593676 RepID=UPI00225200C5|nr:hypothetical protein [Streptomyces sp. NBC_00638]MCX5007993.1 hypothetical protein [Streptomyces sp. NBC_00638]